MSEKLNLEEAIALSFLIASILDKLRNDQPAIYKKTMEAFEEFKKKTSVQTKNPPIKTDFTR